MGILSELAVKMATKAATKKAAVRAAEEAVAPRMAVKALPAPPKRLALPAPKPKPDPRFKPRGGQWMPDATMSYSPRHAVNHSPENAVYREALGVANNDQSNWLQKALLKYYKNDFGTEADPLRDLAARGMHYDPEMTPDRWVDVASGSLRADPIGRFTVPPHRTHSQRDINNYDFTLGPQVTQAAPWLAKQPVTDNIYGISSPLDLSHFNDELHNALRPDASGLPVDLAVRPESLQRMSFPQAVEHVGRINQFRVKQMEEAAQAALNNPAIHPHKDYGDGMRWVELKAPPPPEPPADWGWTPTAEGHYLSPEGKIFKRDPERPMGFDAGDDYWHVPAELAPRTHLQDALRHEGDTMGHCVGGYCDDVASGRSRIFSLRDAKGQPHVTVETNPGRHEDLARRVPQEVQKQIDTDLAGSLNYGRDFNRAMVEWAEKNMTPADDIIQIKGKQNRAPNDEYLPYVQDFVKSGQWGNVGDIGNAGLVKLPDGRYITQAQMDEGANNAFGAGAAELLRTGNYSNEWWDQNWPTAAPHFQGYAYGGRVEHARDFARNPLAAGRG